MLPTMQYREHQRVHIHLIDLLATADGLWHSCMSQFLALAGPLDHGRRRRRESVVT